MGTDGMGFLKVSVVLLLACLVSAQPYSPWDRRYIEGKADTMWVLDKGYSTGASGESNTASNLGGGLATYSTKVGVDLRFNSFADADFDLASNLFSIDNTKWATIIYVTGLGYQTVALAQEDADTTTFDATKNDLTVDTTALHNEVVADTALLHNEMVADTALLHNEIIADTALLHNEIVADTTLLHNEIIADTLLLHNEIIADTTISHNWQVATFAPLSTTLSGTYSPALTNVVNIAASTNYSCQYIRVGTVVTVSGQVDIDPTATATSTQLGIALPIASALANANECAGTAFSNKVGSMGAAILGDATNDRAQLEYISSNIANQTWYFSFTYRIL